MGGCVRDLLLGKTPKDWDVTTNALPEQIISLFPDTFYENEYGTVGVVNEKAKDETLKVIEVTPYRTEGKYSDRRRPDSVSFDANLEDDLNRRDFTINAIAIDFEENRVVDPHNGQKDLDSRIICAVGNPAHRFEEDGLRILRAVRLSAELDFRLDSKTEGAIKNTANLLDEIAKERIRDEFVKIIESKRPMEGLILAQRLGILAHIAPELESTIGVEQNQAHAFEVWVHLLKSLQHAADKDWPLNVRLAALFHDISKPETRYWSKEKKQWTFYGHEVVGAKTTAKILKRLKFPNDLTDNVVKLVRWHMFFSDTEKISLSAVRRLVARVGKESVWDLMKVRNCDRIGTGRPKESPYRLRKYQSMIEEVLRDPVTVGMLKIGGGEIMEITGIEPGPKIGHILHALLQEVLEDPGLNTKKHLQNRAKELATLPEEELKALGQEGKEKREEEEEKNLSEIRKKYWVK